jgi:hypothetical protein
MSDEIIKPDFAKCVKKTGVQYYKKSIFWSCVTIVVGATIYGLAIACATLFPLLINAAISVPLWIYIPVGLLLTPGVATVVVCYIRREKKEIEDADKDYVCPDE